MYIMIDMETRTSLTVRIPIAQWCALVPQLCNMCVVAEPTRPVRQVLYNSERMSALYYDIKQYVLFVVMRIHCVAACVVFTVHSNNFYKENRPIKP